MVAVVDVEVDAMYGTACFLILKNGVPIFMPSAFASLERATTQPSLLESTTTALPSSQGWKTLSQDTKKLLQSTSAYIIANLSEFPQTVPRRGAFWKKEMTSRPRY